VRSSRGILVLTPYQAEGYGEMEILAAEQLSAFYGTETG
jgi:hypothetical protein